MTDDDRAELDAYWRETRRDEMEYQQGKAEVEQIQAFSAPGSALREQMYLDMEMAAHNRGEEF